MTLESLTPLEIKEIIRSEFRQLPKTYWIQNLRHPSYHLRQPIPILIERADDIVTATYDDVELCGMGDSVKAAMSDLCTKIVARYKELGGALQGRRNISSSNKLFRRLNLRLGKN